MRFLQCNLHYLIPRGQVEGQDRYEVSAGGEGLCPHMTEQPSADYRQSSLFSVNDMNIIYARDLVSHFTTNGKAAYMPIWVRYKGHGVRPSPAIASICWSISVYMEANNKRTKGSQKLRNCQHFAGRKIQV